MSPLFSRCCPSVFRGLRGPRTPAAVALPLHPDLQGGMTRIPEGADRSIAEYTDRSPRFPRCAEKPH